MTRRIISNPEQSASCVTDLPLETTDLNAHQFTQVSGGCYPTPEEEFSEEYDPTLEGILDDVDPYYPWSWPMKFKIQ